MTDQIPKPPIDKQAFLKSANEVRVILESEGKIPVQPAEEQDDEEVVLQQPWTSIKVARAYSAEEVERLITQEKQNLLDEVARQSEDFNSYDPESSSIDSIQAVPLSVIEGLRRKV